MDFHYITLFWSTEHSKHLTSLTFIHSHTDGRGSHAHLQQHSTLFSNNSTIFYGQPFTQSNIHKVNICLQNVGWGQFDMQLGSNISVWVTNSISDCTLDYVVFTVCAYERPHTKRNDSSQNVNLKHFTHPICVFLLNIISTTMCLHN